MKTDIQIEKATPKLPIGEIAGRLGLGEDDFLPHGRHIAKLPYSLLRKEPEMSKSAPETSEKAPRGEFPNFRK